jgi:hypothetical protein
MLLAATSLPDVGPLEFVGIAARADYDGVGLRLYHRSDGPVPLTRDAQLLGQVKAAITSAGLEVLDVFSCYLRPQPDFDGLRQAMACGAELGAKYALAICSDTDWARTVENLSRLCELATNPVLNLPSRLPNSSASFLRSSKPWNSSTRLAVRPRLPWTPTSFSVRAIISR